jgi:RHS repeat-associated protein
LHFLRWDYKDQFYNTSNGTYSSFYSYDAQGNRTRKVIDKNNIIETRYYIDGFELYRRKVNGAIDYERTTLNISDEEKVFVRVEKKTNEPEIVRYQYDNHLGSACLELDYTGRIISYEEYHPFGTTSYRSGRSETEVSLKRYKYCGKERDEQTGFYYYGMRYYAGWLCRFVSVDPMADEYPSLTPYNYCSNNPVSRIDIWGLFDDKAEALKSQRKAARKFGKDRVGSVFNAGTSSNPDYRYSMFNEGKDNKTRPGTDGEVRAYHPDAVISSKGDYKQYKKAHTTHQFGLTLSLGAQIGIRKNWGNQRTEFSGNLNSINLLEVGAEKKGNNSFKYKGYIFNPHGMEHHITRGVAVSVWDLPSISYDYSAIGSEENIVPGTEQHTISILGTSINNSEFKASFALKFILGIEIYYKKTIR